MRTATASLTLLQVVLIGLECMTVDGGKLQSTYIPPNFSLSSGGHDSFLNPPSNQYLPPAAAAAGAVTTGAALPRKSNFLHHMKHSQRGQPFTSSLTSGSSGYAGVANGNSDDEKPPVPILKYENNNLGGGTYNFEYRTGDGQSRMEKGHVLNKGTKYEEQVITGSYSYTGADGRVYTIRYKADKNGFQATGDHLPTPPTVKRSISKQKSSSSPFSNYGNPAPSAVISSFSHSHYAPSNNHNGYSYRINRLTY